MELKPIESLFLDLPSAESREQFFSISSRHAPVLNRAKKKWADPSKLNLAPDARVTYLVLDGEKLAEITMSALEAANVNFPESGSSFDAMPEVPWPCRALENDEKLVVVNGVAMVEKGAS
ncbi:MAG: hypothetical protein M3O20_07085 [Acidobacteriota bacterium]|nr:hypothetical protein [Acidobacteriota bacterium]